MIQNIIKLLKPDLIEVQKIIQQQTAQCDSALLKEILSHTFQVKGKLLRPILHLACAHLLEPKDKAPFYKIAAGLEILHTASLIHDDIIDDGELRRGVQTVHKKWGLAEATLLGDWLLSKAFSVITHNNPSDCNPIMSQLTCELVEGQYLEIEYNNRSSQNLEYLEEQYLKMIDLKTGSIFRAACNFAIACNNDFTPKQKEALNLYATDFGMIFQIVDDLIDFGGNSKKYGKTTGYDFLNGLITLPVMNAIKFEEKTLDNSPILNAFQKSDNEYLSQNLHSRVHQTDALKITIQSVENLKVKSLSHLEVFKDTMGKKILSDLITYTISRVPQEFYMESKLTTNESI
ncbi:MAG: polyprenyl synthetase family protein [Candidatus Cloacimonetes bacterium]|nr:polyprenyl synthetase family protein [Candidatus Cloacimonadota bacterium]